MIYLQYNSINYNNLLTRRLQVYYPCSQVIRHGIFVGRSAVYTLHSSLLCVGYDAPAQSIAPRPDGSRRTRRSNLLPADLSLPPVTSLSMLPGFTLYRL